jgi:uncharacterized protein YqgV (UPF0045/DUF77 family)
MAAAFLCACAGAMGPPRGWANSVLQSRSVVVSPNAAARFSIYPKAAPGQSLKATIKAAVSGVGALGVSVEADDVSSLLTGAQDDVFDAIEGVFGRAASVAGKPHVSMQCTFSTDVRAASAPLHAQGGRSERGRLMMIVAIFSRAV